MDYFIVLIKTRSGRGDKKKDKKAERKYKGKARGFDKVRPFKESCQYFTFFVKGLEPDKIIGATDDSGELMFLISWKVEWLSKSDHLVILLGHHLIT